VGWIVKTFIFAAFLLNVAAASAAVRVAPVPEWVEELTLPAIQERQLDQASAGVYYLLSDGQLLPGQKQDTSYFRTAYKVFERHGLEEAGRIEIQFDPIYQQPFLHYVRIWRNGVAADRMRDMKVEILRRESDLDGGVIDGQKMIHIELHDVQVGDVVDYAYGISSKHIFWPGHVFGGFATGWSVPLAVNHYRILMPSGYTLGVRNEGTNLPYKVRKTGGRTEYQWREENIAPLTYEKNTPPWHNQWGRVSFSTMNKWEDVVIWALPYYSDKDRLPASLVARVNQIMQRHPGTSDRITAALRLVQDNIRYVSVSMGMGSYVPRSPAEVIANGFGDCKDKSQLLVAILRHMGITANAALTHSDKAHILPQYLPSPIAFNHVVVQIKVGKNTYWVDATRSHQGGRFPNITSAKHGWTLPLVSGQTELELIPQQEIPAPNQTVMEEYELLQETEGGLILHVDSTYSEQGADQMRANLAARSLAAFGKEYFDFYDKYYPGLQVAEPIKFKDDRESNVLVVSERYKLSKAALEKNEMAKKFVAYISTFDNYSDIPATNRRSPFYVQFPLHKRHVIVFNTPGFAPQAPAPVTVDGAAFKYSLYTDRQNDRLTLDARLVGTAEILPAEKYTQYREALEALDNNTSWYIDITSKAGGVIGQTDERMRIFVMLVGGLLFGAAAIFGIWKGLHADDVYAASGFYYPVSPLKLIVMSVLTFGFYDLFWLWKSWRWAKIYDDKDCWPFWRMIFALFWLYPLFRDVNKRRDTFYGWTEVGVISAVLYAVCVVGANMSDRLYENDLIFIAATLIAPLFLLPTLVSMNKLNGDREALRVNSKLGGLTVAAAIPGILLWALVLLELNEITLPNLWSS